MRPRTETALVGKVVEDVKGRHVGWVGAALLAFTASGGQAQTPASGDGLTLGDAIRTAVSRNVAIQYARRQLDLRVGDILVESAPFDARLGITVTGAQDPGATANASAGAQPASRRLSYQVGLTKQFRFGLAVQPVVSVARLDLQKAGVPSAGTAAVGLHAVLPLARDRWGIETRSGERAARVAHEAESLRTRHEAAAAILDVTTAYWNHLAARRRLGVVTASEQRAQRLVEEIGVLVDAEERPASDLDQARANLATKRITRIAAEQAVVTARWRLGVEIGLPAGEMVGLPAPATDFPEPRPFDAPPAAAELLQAALATRSDLAAAARDRDATEELLVASRSQARPRFDLTVSVGYEGSAIGNSFEPLVRPLYRNIPGVRASIQIDYQQPFANAEARGRELQRRALYEQQRLLELDLARRIRSGIAVASEALSSSAVAAGEATRAVELYRTTVDNERQKNQLGVATLFDVILAEDRLTEALLNEVGTELEFALALATLRFESGTLVEGAGSNLSVHVDQLLTPP